MRQAKIRRPITERGHRGYDAIDISPPAKSKARSCAENALAEAWKDTVAAKEGPDFLLEAVCDFLEDGKLTTRRERRGCEINHSFIQHNFATGTRDGIRPFASSTTDDSDLAVIVDGEHECDKDSDHLCDGLVGVARLCYRFVPRLLPRTIAQQPRV